MPSSCSNSFPVVPVAYSSCLTSRGLLNAAHSRRSCFLLSCATRAILFLLSIIMMHLSFHIPRRRQGVFFTTCSLSARCRDAIYRVLRLRASYHHRRWGSAASHG